MTGERKNSRRVEAKRKMWRMCERHFVSGEIKRII
jgi:hypothetical protein